jgi:hypothetical protein
LNHPTDVIFDNETDSLIISDWGNRRVTRWLRRSGIRSGETIINNIGCCGLTMDNEGSLYVIDWQKHEVRRYRRGETSGIVVAGGNGEGAGLHQLNEPSYVCVDEDHAVYVSDFRNDRVMKWEMGVNEGIIVAGGRGEVEDRRGVLSWGGVETEKERQQISSTAPPVYYSIAMGISMLLMTVIIECNGFPLK